MKPARYSDAQIMGILKQAECGVPVPERHREAVAAIRLMRERLNRPEVTAKELLLMMKGNGLLDSANVLRDHVDRL